MRHKIKNITGHLRRVPPISKLRKDIIMFMFPVVAIIISLLERSLIITVVIYSCLVFFSFVYLSRLHEDNYEKIFKGMFKIRFNRDFFIMPLSIGIGAFVLISLFILIFYGNSITALGAGVIPVIIIIRGIVNTIEELFWRGSVQNGFIKRFGPVQGILITSALFVVFSLNTWFFSLVVLNIITAFIVSFILGVLYFKRRNVVQNTIARTIMDVLIFSFVF
ncbi:MAG: CPBP family intramembrane glutamic endopeptidase [Candidatus Aenigmatarchaeota archaeon]|nr:CPBP family intramembrane metalloprotease [Nanoarchaeota archaeon]